MTEVPGKRAIAAMSGGVDSSVVAKLLLDAGYEVVGATLKLFSDADLAPFDFDFAIDPELSCCSQDGVKDAAGVAAKLGIAHEVLDFTGVFGHQVVDRFCASYLRGETPNPCIDCNRFVKFRTLQDWRAQTGYDYVATGHYAQCGFDEKRGRYVLRMGVDAGKDQSYVLYSLSQDDLAHTLFPLGGMAKSDVRVLAQAAGFANAQKAESQDICFIPDGDYRGFIRRRTGRSLPAGDIVDTSGAVLGRHDGLDCYTIGQRKGIGIAAPQPLYVCRKDMDKNQLVVGFADQAQCSQVSVDHVNWVAVEGLDAPMEVTAKTFYRQKAVPATLVQTGTQAVRLDFSTPIRACAPGQAAVFYDGDVVVGGGTIVSCRL